MLPVNRTRCTHRTVAAFGLAAIASASCKNGDPRSVAVPVYACILRGTAWTAGPKTTPAAITQAVNQLVFDANENVWTPGADITMIPEIDRTGNVPVIDDPEMSSGMPGDVVTDRAEGELVANACRVAWGNAMIPGALVIVIAHNMINTDGSRTGEAGFAEASDELEKRDGGAALCTFPRHLQPSDVMQRYLIIMDPMILGLRGERGNGIPYVVLAHEFGHVLTLYHGDGLDNNNNSQLPPNPGSRSFDESCDAAEYSQMDRDPNGNTSSLMNAVAGYTKTITPLQVELARTAAPLLPGAVGPQP